MSAFAIFVAVYLLGALVTTAVGIRKVWREILDRQSCHACNLPPFDYRQGCSCAYCADGNRRCRTPEHSREKMQPNNADDGELALVAAFWPFAALYGLGLMLMEGINAFTKPKEIREQERRKAEAEKRRQERERREAEARAIAELEQKAGVTSGD